MERAQSDRERPQGANLSAEEQTPKAGGPKRVTGLWCIRGAPTSTDVGIFKGGGQQLVHSITLADVLHGSVYADRFSDIRG